MKNVQFVLHPVGILSNKLKDSTLVIIYDSYKAALDGLTVGQWIHLIVWLHLSDTEQKRKILKVHPMDDSHFELKGVFATRSPIRPNPIGIYLVKINFLDFDRGRLGVTKIDTFENTPVIDIKPFVDALDSIGYL